MGTNFSNSPQNMRARGDVDYAHDPRLRKKAEKDDVWEAEFHHRFGYAADEFLQPAARYSKNRETDLNKTADGRRSLGDGAYGSAAAFEHNDVDNASTTRRSLPEV